MERTRAEENVHENYFFQNNLLADYFKRKILTRVPGLQFDALALQPSYPGEPLGQARIIFLLDPHYPPEQHLCHLSMVENTYVGITLIRGFYVNNKASFDENLVFQNNLLAVLLI